MSDKAKWQIQLRDLARDAVCKILETYGSDDCDDLPEQHRDAIDLYDMLKGLLEEACAIGWRCAQHPEIECVVLPEEVGKLWEAGE